VEREFVLASLKAWILKPPHEVDDLGLACRKTTASGVMLEREEAIGACYQQLFATGSSVLVSDSPIHFPAGQRQYIRRPVDLIEDRFTKASSLEAALLLTAVVQSHHTDGIDPDLILLVAPVEGAADPSHKTVFIAWREAGPWRAVDLRVANTQPFQANVAAASAKVAKIMGDNAEFADSVDAKGAGFSKNDRFAALDFAKVPQKYWIHGLP
jgi:hypothetical protein